MYPLLFILTVNFCFLLSVLNISTSAQLAFEMHEKFQPPALDTQSAIEYFPSFNGRYLAVAASLKVWGTNYFSLFVSYRFMSNKTQLTEFPESKSDMPLFHWVLALK